MSYKQSLLNRINCLKAVLHSLIEKYSGDLLREEVIVTSQNLDKVLNEYNSLCDL